ncbi:MAG: hypothetical protein RLZZ282_664 [Verrucomicrobiota bacterium]
MSASAPVCEALDDWLAAHPSLHTLAVYAALPGEVDLADLVARHADRTWLYPRVVGDHLTFHIVTTPASQLVAGAFNVQEPTPTLTQIPVTSIDAFLCPGLAFDENGGRLGRGRGFYDRMLAGARPNTLKIGVCFAGQIVPDTFSEPHDIPMDCVVFA